MKSLMFLVGLIFSFWLLYDRGFLTVGSKRAVYFMGRLESASYKACSGVIHRIFRPKESGPYTFSLELQLQKGSVTVELLDRWENGLLRLDRSNRCAAVSLEKGEKYYLLVRFEGAEGSHRLIKQ